MTEVHRQHVEWHDPSCSSIDVIQTPALVACLSCGSSGPAPPPALYLPLPDDSSVRLLQLLSGGPEDPIECRLRVCSLLSKPVFSAISYTWADENGDDTKCEEITINGQAFQVSRNCHTALRRARNVIFTAPIWIDAIWIDAICINQSNTEERGHQVKLMSEIYLRAQRVFVYVGEHNNESRDLLDMIGQLSQPQVPGRTKTLLGQISKSAWNYFLARRYFSRLWILQELALAKHAIILCGDSSLAWGHFAYYSRLIKKVHKIEENSIFMFDRSLYLSPDKELLLLDHGRRSNAADPRDKVYGLLGLLPAKRLGPIVADYTLPVDQLYTRLALELASRHGWGAVLDRAGTARQHLSSLPSWAPDWSFTDELQEGNSKPEALQCHTIKREQITLNLAKCPGENDQWALLNEADRPLEIYFPLSVKSKLFEQEAGLSNSIVGHAKRGRHFLLTTQHSFDETFILLCSTSKNVKNDSMIYVRLEDLLWPFLLTMDEIGICAMDKHTLSLHQIDTSGAAESPSLVLDSLSGEYLRLSAAGPVEDWVLEAENLWDQKQKELLKQRWFRKRWFKQKWINGEYEKLYNANDAFWRLLVRRCAVKEQAVHIA